MVSTDDVKVHIISSEKPFKDLKETVNFKTSNLKDYVTVLRTMQKAVNSALTEIVDQEKCNETIADQCMDDEGDDDDDDSDVEEKPNSTAKRKLKSYKNNKKMKL